PAAARTADSRTALELALLTGGAERPAPELVDSPRQAGFSRRRASSCACSIEELSLGWRSKSKYQEIPFAHRVGAAVKAAGLALRLRLGAPARFESAVPGRLPCWPQVELEFTPIRRKLSFRLRPDSWRHLSITRRAQLPRQRLADAWSPAWHGAVLAGAAGGPAEPTDCLLDLCGRPAGRGEEALIELRRFAQSDGQAGLQPQNCISIAAFVVASSSAQLEIVANFHSSSPPPLFCCLGRYSAGGAR
uniref:ANK_REP_REGION domain-containing protein n=1 Tax=Macrostomum lignano TaxID=282301 RepID=A0A1I8F9Z8_9PLAT